MITKKPIINRKIIGVNKHPQIKKNIATIFDFNHTRTTRPNQYKHINYLILSHHDWKIQKYKI